MQKPATTFYPQRDGYGKFPHGVEKRQKQHRKKKPPLLGVSPFAVRCLNIRQRHQILSIPYFLRYHGRDHIPLPVSRTRYYGYAVIINTLPSLYHDRARFKRDPILLFYRRDRCSDGRAFFGDFVTQFQLTNVRAGSKIKRL